MRDIAATEARYNRLLWVAGAISALVGLTHLFVSSDYLSRWWGYGYFFIWAGLSQLAFAFVIFLLPWLNGAGNAPEEKRASTMRLVYMVGVVGNLAIVLLYVVTRTLGVPFVGPAANVVLPLTPLSVAVTLGEVTLVVILLMLARQRLPARAEPEESVTA
jgi:hypothetical protein